MYLLLEQFRLVIEHWKTEVFHFSRSQEAFNPPPLNLSILGGPIFLPQRDMVLFGFHLLQETVFLLTHQFLCKQSHLHSKKHENLTRGLILSQKHLLYRMCILPITLYGFPLWYYNKAPLLYPLKVLRNMQRRAALWILGAFWTSLSLGMKLLLALFQ